MNIRKPGMAWIGKIIDLKPIENADNILRAEVVCGPGGKWTGVIRKNDFIINDPVITFLPDSIVPQCEALAFMEKRNWRVSPMRLRGCPSEVLIMSVDDFNIKDDVGTDITDILGVLKYEKEFPASIGGDAVGNFPIFIPKTDEPMFQLVPEMRTALVGGECYISTKYDGTSQTFYHFNDRIGGTSRNLELRDNGKSAVWQIAHQYELPIKLPKLGNLAIQWECIGPGIQGNPLKLTKIEPRVFNIFNIDQQKYLNYYTAIEIAHALNLPFVTIERTMRYQNFSDDQLREMAEGIYIESGQQREGIVIRPILEIIVEGKRLSFKVINLLYKN